MASRRLPVEQSISIAGPTTCATGTGLQWQNDGPDDSLSDTTVSFETPGAAVTDESTGSPHRAT